MSLWVKSLARTTLRAWIVDVAIGDSPSTGFDGLAKVIEPLVCNGGVVGMSALDIGLYATRRG